ncbi:MAG TPA: glutamate-cysteine ligase family protein, partial [Planctomycetaceae bacterium]|nr:glutamate-cysteine ligase family protein [Planctomycetaceae bacterium]
MGQEILTTRFKRYDFHRFDQLVEQEMELLRSWFRDERFSSRESIAGLELEAWLVDSLGQPTPWNEQVIALTGSSDIVPELSQFNVEFNVAPRPLSGRGIAALIADLSERWRQADAAANQLGTSVVAIGILPTITDSMLSIANMSRLHRYKALNEQVLRLRQGRPIRLAISGHETLVAEHRDVMFEAATTSFQLHLQVPLAKAVRYYNAAVAAAGPMVAVSANSPLLFGTLLWHESRIPVFEQAIDVGGGALARVTFGSDYVHDSLEEIFRENQELFPVLLPLVMDKASERLAHIRLQNGTIWRWNRPLIGFDEDGTPHLRIEHRVLPAGPTMIDMAANMALFYGLVENLAHESPALEARLPFVAAHKNFYQAARSGLDCDTRWLDRRDHPIRQLVLQELLPRAFQGLERLGVDRALAKELLDIIEARARSGQTGSVWQRGFLEKHGRDHALLTRAYRDRQRRNEPVHTWSLDRESSSVSVKMKRSMLRLADQLPNGFLEARAADLAGMLGGPTLIHLQGARPEPLFVSILLHGNEDVGLRAVQQLFCLVGDRPLPRALSVLVGNVAAAEADVRRLSHQPDYNRIWPGSGDDGTPEHAMMKHVVAEMRARRVFASIDLHNNTGTNPFYACVTRRDPASLQLAALFGRNAVFFERPRGVQASAFLDICPSVTCECGRIGDEEGVKHAAHFLDACLHLAEIPRHLPAEGDLHLFHTVATLDVSPRHRITFSDTATFPKREGFDLVLRGDLDRLNFQELPAGTHLGWSKP